MPEWRFTTPAHAQCLQTGLSVLCGGTDTDGFSLVGDLDDFTVLSGAIVSSNVIALPFTVIEVDGVVTAFRNDGTINGIATPLAGITVDAIGAGGFINTGTIFTAGPAISVLGAVNGPFINTSTGLISGLAGLTATGSIASVENHGEIFADDIGINSDDTIGAVINSGLISGDVGVGGQNGIGSITNSGRIEGLLGILSDGTIGLVTNTGEIFGDDNGIEALNITSLINFGLIDSEGDAIDVDGGTGINDETSVIGSLVNHGTIRGDDDGIDVGTLTRLVNSGVIIGGFNGFDESGIAAAVITEIINSGVIRTDGDITTAFAIEERGRPTDPGPPVRAAIDGGPTSLTLNAGSILIGRVDLGDGANTLNIGSGLSLNSTFESDGGASSAGIGSTSDHLVALVPVVINGNNEVQIVAVDQSAFLSFDDALYALVSGIGQATEIRQRALRSDPSLGFASRFAAASDPQPGAFAAFNDAPPFDPNRFWVEAFGSYRQDQSDRTGSDFDHLTGGLVAGVDVPLDPSTTFGVMAGFAGATSENEIDTQETDTLSFFAGVYGSTEAMGLAWDGSLTIGYTDYEADRVTANNLVAGGLETANADFGGWFINPQVTATRETTNPFAGHIFHGFSAAPTLQQSVSLSYAGLFLDGYTETGTTNPLTLDSRSVHIASARAALSLPFERVEADGATTTLRLTGGVEARSQFGDDAVSGTLLGQAVSTTLDDNDFGAGAFLGLSGTYETASGVTAYANAEAMIETDASWQFSATAGLRIAF